MPLRVRIFQLQYGLSDHNLRARRIWWKWWHYYWQIIGQMTGWMEALAHAFNSQETLRLIIHWYWSYRSCITPFPLSLKHAG